MHFCPINELGTSSTVSYEWAKMLLFLLVNFQIFKHHLRPNDVFRKGVTKVTIEKVLTFLRGKND
jgi:hypothetical protein